MKVIHIITGLDVGGAEMMLYKLLTVKKKSSEHIVISLTTVGLVGERIQDAGFTVMSLDMRGPISLLSGVYKLRCELKKQAPDVVQTWMYHADLIGGCVARLSGFRNVIWNIRNSGLDPMKAKKHTRITVKACALLSKIIPKKIISNSKKSVESHQAKGYMKEKFVIVPNGFELERFTVRTERKTTIRDSLAVNENDFLIGLVARFDPQKDHKGFVEAAALLVEKQKDVHFLLCGAQIDSDNEALMGWINKAGLTDYFSLLGLRKDVDQITVELDLATLSSSYGEAFPNVVGEAMACGIPCVVTDVGDSAWIVGESGLVVQPDDPQALADAWETMLLMEREQRLALGLQARQRIEENFSIENIASQYTHLYKEVIS